MIALDFIALVKDLRFSKIIDGIFFSISKDIISNNIPQDACF
jgi:hypothetical protein